MLKFLPYILKTLWRHRARTLLTFSGAAVSLFVFCFVMSLQQGLDRLTSQSDSTLIVFQANKFCPATSHLQQDYDRIIGRLPGVRAVVPIQIFTNNCRASLDVVVFYGVPPQKLRAVRDFELLAGNWSEFENNQDAGVVGQAVAARRNLKPGDRFSIGEVTVTVAGIFTSENKAEENYIYTHLEFLQRTRGLGLVGTVTQHEVVLDSTADPARIADQIDERFRGGPVQTDTRTKGTFQAASLADLVDRAHRPDALSGLCVPGLDGRLDSHDEFHVRAGPYSRARRAADNRFRGTSGLLADHDRKRSSESGRRRDRYRHRSRSAGEFRDRRQCRGRQSGTDASASLRGDRS